MFYHLTLKKTASTEQQNMTVQQSYSFSCLIFSQSPWWPKRHVQGQFEIKLFIVQHKNTTYFIWIKKNWTWPCDHLKTSHLSADNFKKIHDLDGWKPDPTIRSSDTGQRIPCFDSCQLITTLMSNMGALSVFLCFKTSQKVWDWTLIAI